MAAQHGWQKMSHQGNSLNHAGGPPELKLCGRTQPVVIELFEFINDEGEDDERTGK